MTKNEIIIHLLNRGLKQHSQHLLNQELELQNNKLNIEEIEKDIVETKFNIEAIEEEINNLKEKDNV